MTAGEGYDEQALVDGIEAKGGGAVTPTRKGRERQRAIGRDRYGDRDLAGRFRAEAKQHLRVATRYDKTARNFLPFVHLAPTMILLQ